MIQSIQFACTYPFGDFFWPVDVNRLIQRLWQRFKTDFQIFPLEREGRRGEQSQLAPDIVISWLSQTPEFGEALGLSATDANRHGTHEAD